MCRKIPKKLQAGCKFEGIKNELDEHLKNCIYEKIKHYISKTDKDIAFLTYVRRVFYFNIKKCKI